MTTTSKKPIQEVEKVVIRFAGDSGDGMQLTGTQFTSTSALLGNDIATFPDFPSEIRAPAGTLPGVSGFQVHIGRADIRTPGDKPDVLVAMNPAALKVCLPDMENGTTIIVNEDEFTDANLEKATWTSNPLEDGSLTKFRLVKAGLTSLTMNALEDVKELNKAGKARCKNLFALGMVYYLFDRPMEPTLKWLEAKFKKKSQVLVDSNQKVLKAGYYYADTVEMFTSVYKIAAATHMEPGEYRQITGNEATAYGLCAASVKAGVPLFYGSYPITPASDVLHNLAQLKNYNVMTFQAEDEIAGIGTAIGASFAGLIAATGTSSPGVCLKGEALGLAVMTELPLVLINVQRGGPSTGLPTKTEQADLLMSLYGRNGESPIVVLAPNSPSDCFEMAYEAVRIATKYMTPVVLLSDGYIANGTEPWLLPDASKLPPVEITYRTDPENFQAYARNENLARPWVKLGSPGLAHRIGGLEKKDGSGDVNMQPENHQRMCELRQAKVDKVADEIPPLDYDVNGGDDLLVLGWGGTYGSIHMAAVEWNKENPDKKVSSAHIRHISPFPKNTGEFVKKFKKVLIPELNNGQLSLLIRGKFAIDAAELHKMMGRPFMVSELKEAFAAQLNGGAK